MPRNTYTILAIGLLFIGSNWVYSHLTQSAMGKKTSKISAMLDQAEEEAGITAEEKDSTEIYPVRAMRLARRMKEKAESNQKLLDSLTRADREEQSIPQQQNESAYFNDGQ